MKLLRLALFSILVGTAAHAAGDNFNKAAVRTATATDLDAVVAGGDGTLAQVAASNASAAGNGLFNLEAIANSALPSYTAGRAVALQVDLSGRLYVTTDATANLRVNLTQIAGAAPAATNTWPAQLSDGAAYYTGTKTGQLPTALGAGVKSGALLMTMATDQPAISTTQGAPTGAAISVPAATTLTAGAAATTIVLKSGLVVSQATKAYKIRLTALEQVICKLQFNDNATITVLGYVATSGFAPSVEWSCAANFPCGVTTSSTVTTLEYEALCQIPTGGSNNDAHLEIEYCQAASGC